MQIFLGLVGIVISFFLLKYRATVGDMIGEADWMNKVGGVYNLIIIFSLILFFWSIAYMTGTMDIFLAPVMGWIPTGQE